MQAETINWIEVIGTTAKLLRVSKLEVLRRAGIGGNAAMSLSQHRVMNEPQYSEGAHILEQFKEATKGEEPPTKQRKANYYCQSCQASYPVENIYRVAVGVYKCTGCLRRIAAENQRKQNNREKL